MFDMWLRSWRYCHEGRNYLLPVNRPPANMHEQ